MIAALVFIIGLTVATAQDPNFNGGDASWYCGILTSQDCTHHMHHPKCGTNGITYDNMCFLGSAHCADRTIDQKHDGPCASAEATGTTSTLSPQQIVAGEQVILNVQCAILSRQPCTHSIGEMICATDGRTYEDFCEYEKARCTHRDLHVQKLGNCTS